MGLVFSEHAREQWRRRFKKLRRWEIIEAQVQQAKMIGACDGSQYYQTPCGAVLVASGSVVKTVLLGRYLSDRLHDAFRRDAPCR